MSYKLLIDLRKTRKKWYIYANWRYVAEKKYGLFPWQKFSSWWTCGPPRKWQGKDLRGWKHERRRININATVPSCFAHLLHFSLDSVPRFSIGFSLFLLSYLYVVSLGYAKFTFLASSIVCVHTDTPCTYLSWIVISWLSIACARRDAIYLADFILSQEHLGIAIFHDLAK